MQHCIGKVDYGYKRHARAEYAIEYTIDICQRGFGKTIDKFQALRHTIVEHATEVEHCKVFNYAAVARLDKGEYVVKEATMAKLKSTKLMM
jgi:alkylation response protein AidB-like acyl-CoA dehydrogenase